MGREPALRKGRASGRVAAAAQRPGPALHRQQKRRARTRGEGDAAHTAARPRGSRLTVCSRARLAARGDPDERPGRRTVRVGCGAQTQTLTYLVKLFAHIRVNVYVVHTVRHLPSALGAAAAAAASCRSARLGSSSGSGGEGRGAIRHFRGAETRTQRPSRGRMGTRRRGYCGSEGAN